MRFKLTVLLTLVFIWPITRIVKGLVEEKELRIKEGMKIMGLKEHVNWIAWLTTYIIIFSLVAAGITFVCSFTVYSYDLNYVLLFMSSHQKKQKI